MTNVWKNYFNDKPEKQGYYLVRRISDCGKDEFFEVEFFEPQNEYQDVYSSEFKQNVRILKKTSEPKFHERGSFVTEWMEIPK
jgi:hypothetical protein